MSFQGCIAEQKLCHTCGGERKDVYLEEEEAEDEVYIHTSHHRDKTKDSNTWPRKRVRNTQNIATFFPDNSSFDDSETGHRILRGEGSIPENLPPGKILIIMSFSVSISPCSIPPLRNIVSQLWDERRTHQSQCLKRGNRLRHNVFFSVEIFVMPILKLA